MHALRAVAAVAAMLACTCTLGRAADAPVVVGTVGELGVGSGSYNASGGACGYGDPGMLDSAWPFGMVAAIDFEASPFAVGKQQGCGICLQVECTDRVLCGSAPTPVVVQVTDGCKKCGASTIFISPQAYARAVPSTGSAGEADARFRQARAALLHCACCAAPASTPDWLPMTRTYGAVWERSGLPEPPLDVRVTTTDTAPVTTRVLQQAGGGGRSLVASVQLLPASSLAAALGVASPLPSPSPSPTPPVASPSPAAPADGSASSAAGTPTLPPLAPAPLLVAMPKAPADLSSASPPAASPRSPASPAAGPSITPAPVAFAGTDGLPRLTPQRPAVGPASRAVVAAASGASAMTDGCLTLAELLEAMPEAARFLQLMRGVGLGMLLDDSKASVTLLVPVESAFNASIDARPLRDEATLDELILNAPEIQNPLVGYHVLPALWPSWTLQPGTKLNTSDTIDKVNRLQIAAAGPGTLRGVGSSAAVLAADLVACGPSVVHVISQVLLPFSFDQAAVDAISGTQVAPATRQVPLVPASPTPAVKAAAAPAGMLFNWLRGRQSSAP
eukprot:scaffold6.g2824.t1